MCIYPKHSDLFLPPLHRDILGLDLFAMSQNIIRQFAILRHGIGSFTPFQVAFLLSGFLIGLRPDFDLATLLEELLRLKPLVVFSTPV
jgi:hypothetical protein